MKLSTPVLLTLLLATPPFASGAESGTETKTAAGAKAGEGAKGSEGTAKKPTTRKGAKGKEQQESGGVSKHARAIARQAKSVYIYASESCSRAADTCDKELLGNAESQFLEACGACNSSSRCEAERDAIRAGTARASQDPCGR